jgi:hypothetical protein
MAAAAARRAAARRAAAARSGSGGRGGRTRCCPSSPTRTCGARRALGPGAHAGAPTAHCAARLLARLRYAWDWLVCPRPLGASRLAARAQRRPPAARAPLGAPTCPPQVRRPRYASAAAPSAGGALVRRGRGRGHAARARVRGAAPGARGCPATLQNRGCAAPCRAMPFATRTVLCCAALCCAVLCKRPKGALSLPPAQLFPGRPNAPSALTPQLTPLPPFRRRTTS